MKRTQRRLSPRRNAAEWKTIYHCACCEQQPLRDLFCSVSFFMRSARRRLFNIELQRSTYVFPFSNAIFVKRINGRVSLVYMHSIHSANKFSAAFSILPRADQRTGEMNISGEGESRSLFMLITRLHANATARRPAAHASASNGASIQRHSE